MAIHRYTKKSKEMGKGMKLIKKDFNKWDKEELSIIIKGYTARQIADHILDNQKIVSRLQKEIKKLPKCFSKECMGCEIDMQRHLLTKILGDKK